MRAAQGFALAVGQREFLFPAPTAVCRAPIIEAILGHRAPKLGIGNARRRIRPRSTTVIECSRSSCSARPRTRGLKIGIGSEDLIGSLPDRQQAEEA
jgi:hypothetical protein